MRRVAEDVRASLLSWSRSPSAVFFTLAFPLLLIGVFGAVFGPGDPEVAVAAQDNDGSEASRGLLAALEATRALRVVALPPGGEAGALALAGDHHTTLVIPQGYAAALRAGRAQVELITDPSRPSSAAAEGVVRAVVQEVNLRASGAAPRVQVQERELDLPGGGRYIDFFLPGVLGMTVMTNAVMGGLATSARLRSKGILRKIATTPIRRWEWVLAKVLYQALLAGLSAAVILAAGVLLFGVQVRLGWEVPALVVLAAVLFAGLAMALGRVVREEDQANAAGSAVTFPMMFLAGTFFPLESMPPALQAVAAALPLTYVNEALRAAMVTGRSEALLLHGGVVAVLALAAVAAGSLLVAWREP